MNETNKAFMSTLDTETLKDKIATTEDGMSYFDGVIEQTVKKYTEKLDNIMKSIYVDVVDKEDTPIEIIEKHFLKLTNAIYFLGSSLENIGVRDDVSEMLYKEVFNAEYLDQQNIERDKKLTQATLQALADNKAKYENAINVIYARAYKIMKFKVDSANEMVRTLSKVLSRRMQENELVVTADRRVNMAVSHAQAEDDTQFFK